MTLDLTPSLAPETQLPPRASDSGALLDAGEDERLQRLADELRRQLLGEHKEGGC